MRLSRLLWAGVIAVGVVGCSDQLVVENPNQPDGERALARPSDVENLVGSSYLAVHTNTLGGSNDAIQPQTLVMGWESYSNLANFGTGPRAAICAGASCGRAAIDNSRGNQVLLGNYRDFLGLHRAARQAATGLARLQESDFTFFPASAAQTRRAQAMAFFTIGTALGNVALIYDQGVAVGPENNGLSDPVPLVPYDSLMKYAITMLDSAIAIAGGTAPAGANWFPTPAAWFSVSLSANQFRDLARAYRARFRANVARTPTDRAAVNWTLVIADALAGAAAFPSTNCGNASGGTCGFEVASNPSLGWDVVWPIQHYASNSTNWHMMWQFIVGMADTSGAFEAWLALPVASRQPFTVVTPDTRYPPGTTRTAQQNSSACASAGTCAPPNGVYFRNRSVPDWQGENLATSFYDHVRFRGFYNANRIGNYPVFTTTEMNMLAAEGYIRTNQFDQAAALINVSRGWRGLPALPNGMTAATPVPGGQACVPKIPAAPSFNTAVCGTILEAMKWEKRMEGGFTGPYLGYLDSRGWGDLPEGTALMWPTPYQEIDTRQAAANPPPYVLNYGGVGGTNAAPKGTYGI